MTTSIIKAPTARSVVAALVLALPLMYPVIVSMVGAAHSTFGRDQGIYQYVAWAISQGERNYVDVCDINGPLTHAIHQVFQALGGTDELGFRVLDLVASSVAFATIGAAMPGLTRVAGSPAPAPAPACRVAWALATWAVLSVQYLSYNPWNLAQREAFCNWFLLGSIAAQLLVQGSAGALGARPRNALLFAAGLLSVLPWFIKPTYVLCSALQLTLLVERSSWRQSLRAFAIGGSAGVTVMLAWTAVFGDVLAFLRIYLLEGPLVYGPIWRAELSDLILRTGFPHWGGYAVLAGLVGSVLVRRGVVPRRALLIGLLPLCAFLQVLIQRKGFTYHYHTVTMAVVLCAVGTACVVSERQFSGRYAAVMTFGAPVAVALYSLGGLFRTPESFHHNVYRQGQTTHTWSKRWEPFEGSSYASELQHLSLYFYHMRYIPWDHGRAANYLRETTNPDDRVFLYASSPYLLYLAQRLSAACPLYVCQLNVDSALDGRAPDRIYRPGTRADARSEAALLKVRNDYEERAFGQLASRPPAALVFVDDEPFLSHPNAWTDFEAHSPKTASWLKQRYEPRARFGTVEVWEPIQRGGI